MNLLFTVNHNFVKPLCVLLNSIRRNTSKKITNTIYLPFIENDPFTSREKKQIKKQVKKNDRIIYVELPATTIIYAHDKKRWGYQIWMKLTCLYFLPEKLDKLLFIDSDCVINKDITKFYNQENSSYSFIGINEEGNERALKRLGFSKNDKYICASFLLMNPKFITKIMNSFESLKDNINKYPYIFDCDEQDFFNYFFQDSIHAINDRRYNFFVLWTEEYKGEKIIVYHYAGSPKPWIGYGKKYSFHNFNVYWKYAIRVYGIYKYCSLILKAIIISINKKLRS